MAAVGDGPNSAPVLAWAEDEAATINDSLLELVVCRSHPDSTGAPSRRTSDPAGPANFGTPIPADPILASLAGQARARLGDDRVVVTAARTDTATRVLVNVAERASLLAIGPSVAPGYVASHAPCPVAVVRPLNPATGQFSGHIVVGVDDDPVADDVDFGLRRLRRPPLGQLAGRTPGRVASFDGHDPGNRNQHHGAAVGRHLKREIELAGDQGKPIDRRQQGQIGAGP